MRQPLSALLALSLVLPGPAAAASLARLTAPTRSAPTVVPTVSLTPSSFGSPLALSLAPASASILTAPATMPAVVAPAIAPVEAAPVAAEQQVEVLAESVKVDPQVSLDLAFDAIARNKKDSSLAVAGKETAVTSRLPQHRTIAASAVAAVPLSVPAAADSGSSTGLIITGAIIAFGLAVWGINKWREHRATQRMIDAAKLEDELSQLRRRRSDDVFPHVVPQRRFGFDPAPQTQAPKPQEPTSTFADVAGQEEAKGELRKVVNYLKDPEKYRKVGAKGFKGVLLYGPPGTGKTLIARAVASEAGAAFFHANGSDFVEQFVGVGAKRIRELFEKARRSGGPAIIFIDEVDGIGRKRSDDGRGNSEYEQTLNALLAEMDGFKSDNVVVIAATNRPDMLDPALTRGRRFGLKVPVGLPDVEGRTAIFGVHTAKMTLAKGVELRKLAEQTPGLAGADIEELANDAAMMAAERGAEAIELSDFLKAIDRNMIGHERKLIMSPQERNVVAYHESGHALVSHLLPDADPVRKVTIVPHGLNALGLMQAVPEHESHIQSRAWLLDRMAVALGGRAAEKLATGDVYSGAQNDLEAATRIARYMVMKFGMSEKLGPVDYGTEVSPEMRRLIDSEVKALLDEALARAEKVLVENRPILDAMAKELLEKETLRAEDMQRLIPNGR